MPSRQIVVHRKTCVALSLLLRISVKYISKHFSRVICERMRSAPLILFIVTCCCLLVSNAKRVKVEGKEFDVKPYPEDCSKYLLCRKGVCNLMYCQYTYVFDPVTGTCTHRTRGTINCDRRSPKKHSFP